MADTPETDDILSLAARVLAGDNPIDNDQVILALVSAIAEANGLEEVREAVRTVFGPYVDNMLSLAGRVMADEEQAIEDKAGELAMNLVDQLRADEGATVAILSDNPEASDLERQCAVEVCGPWSDWRTVRFYGETVPAALAAAAKGKAGEPGGEHGVIMDDMQMHLETQFGKMMGLLKGQYPIGVETGNLAKAMNSSTGDIALTVFLAVRLGFIIEKDGKLIAGQPIMAAERINALPWPAAGSE